MQESIAHYKDNDQSFKEYIIVNKNNKKKLKDALVTDAVKFQTAVKWIIEHESLEIQQAIMDFLNKPEESLTTRQIFAVEQIRGLMEQSQQSLQIGNKELKKPVSSNLSLAINSSAMHLSKPHSTEQILTIIKKTESSSSSPILSAHSTVSAIRKTSLPSERERKKSSLSSTPKSQVVKSKTFDFSALNAKPKELTIATFITEANKLAKEFIELYQQFQEYFPIKNYDSVKFKGIKKALELLKERIIDVLGSTATEQLRLAELQPKPTSTLPIEGGSQLNDLKKMLKDVINLEFLMNRKLGFEEFKLQHDLMNTDGLEQSINQLIADVDQYRSTNKIDLEHGTVVMIKLYEEFLKEVLAFCDTHFPKKEIKRHKDAQLKVDVGLFASGKLTAKQILTLQTFVASLKSKYPQDEVYIQTITDFLTYHCKYLPEVTEYHFKAIAPKFYRDLAACLENIILPDDFRKNRDHFNTLLTVVNERREMIKLVDEIRSNACLKYNLKPLTKEYTKFKNVPKPISNSLIPVFRKTPLPGRP